MHFLLRSAFSYLTPGGCPHRLPPFSRLPARCAFTHRRTGNAVKKRKGVVIHTGLFYRITVAVLASTSSFFSMWTFSSLSTAFPTSVLIFHNEMCSSRWSGRNWIILLFRELYLFTAVRLAPCDNHFFLSASFLHLLLIQWTRQGD